MIIDKSFLVMQRARNHSDNIFTYYKHKFSVNSLIVGRNVTERLHNASRLITNIQRTYRHCEKQAFGCRAVVRPRHLLVELVQLDPLDMCHVDAAWILHTVDGGEDYAAVEVPRRLVVELAQVLDSQRRLQIAIQVMFSNAMTKNCSAIYSI